MPHGVREFDVVSIDGDPALTDLAADLGSLHADLDVPVNGRLRWLDTWASLAPDWSPWTVAVRDRESGKLGAGALLARRQTDDHVEVVAMGHGPFGAARLPARDRQSALHLAKAIAAQLSTEPGSWTLSLDNLDDADLAGRMLLDLLPGATAMAVPSVPFVDVCALRKGVHPYTNNMRRQLRKAENRLASDGKRADIQFADTEAEIRLLLPQLHRIHIERDHAAGRTSDLDDPTVHELWNRLVLAHTAGGQVEVATLSIEGAIVAYVIGLRDGHTYRVFDGHFDTLWARYSPGRLVEDAVLRRVIADERYSVVDWMLGVAAEKILSATGARDAVSITATSQPTHIESSLVATSSAQA